MTEEHRLQADHFLEDCAFPYEGVFMSNRKAIVTGGSMGIGKGIVRKLASQGYDIVFSYGSHEEEAKQLKKELVSSYSVKAECLKAKLEIPGNGEEFFDEAVEILGGLDALVNNAGVTIFESLLDLTDKNMDYMLNLDFRNYVVLMHKAVRYMAEHGTAGAIVNITSSRGTQAYPGDGIYGACKAGLNRAIESFALDAAPYGIRINTVAPGAIRVRTREEFEADPARKGKRYGWDDLGPRIPLERCGTPEDIGSAVAFLLSDESSYITGVTLRVDGGLILPGMPERTDTSLMQLGWGRVEKKKIDEE